MYLESPRLIIRDLDESMAESIHLNSLDADNRRFLPDEVFETPARALAALQYLIARYDDQEGPFAYAVLLKEGQQIGYIQLVKIQEGWEIGFQVGQAYRGLGYASEAVKAFLPAIMEKRDIPQVYGICLQANLGSRKVMERCGFGLIYEGSGHYRGKMVPICKYLFQDLPLTNDAPDLDPVFSKEAAMQESYQIIKVEDAQEKARIVQEVLLDLPDWFGLPESTQNYIQESKALPLWAAHMSGQVLGFVTLAESSPDTGELHCMGVKLAFHRQGIGRALVQELERFAKEKYIFLQVKTVDEGHYETYDRTIAFYRSLGFYKLQVFPHLWDEWNPCLVMVKALGSPPTS